MRSTALRSDRNGMSTRDYAGIISIRASAKAISGTGFSRVDTFVSPRIAVIFKPDGTQSYYLSYGNSYNPVIEYLIIAPSDQSLSPEKNSTARTGAKINILGGIAELTGALFDT